jgi:hypothetical protein
LYYGYSKTDQNLCYGVLGHGDQYYKVKGDVPDLEKAGSITIPLVNNKPNAHPDIDLTITLTQASMVNIRWNYASAPDNVKKPYEIPTKIVDIDLTPGTEMISKYVSWQTLTGNNTGEFIITVKSKYNDSHEPLFTLKSNMMLNQYLNSWEGTF